MIVRQATEADIPPAAAIVAQAYRTSFRPILGEAALAYDAAHFQERFETDLERLTVLDDGGVKGVLLVTEGHIAMLFIDESGRGKGHGAALLAHAEAQGAHSLEVFAANAGARRFYERAGWLAVGEYARDFAGAAREFVRYEKWPEGETA
ncbi:GNAT family N-acetyltransferase [Bosea sp. (in: a-proteobacteria)]|uniref:GNAT family N-acetyltransferase n=1 Tax=Bosea sp. (in: a-proteobacteria) TaxID=1871050 RepID=UPI003F7154EF